MKISQRGRGLIMARARGRVLVSVDVRAARLVSELMLLGVLGWLTVLAVLEHLGYDRLGPSRL